MSEPTFPTEPTPNNPTPGSQPIEIDTGDLHSKPGVDYGNESTEPIEPFPEAPPERTPEREQPHEPDIEPGRQQ